MLEDGDLDQFRVVVETLAGEFDVMEIALAAVKLAHEAGGAAADEEDIPEPAPRSPKPQKGKRPRAGSAGMTRVFVGAGRTAGIRPQDLVGAIAGESELSGRQIGAIEISDRFALVEVPEESVDHVIDALRRTTIKGRKATVRRERF